MFQGDGAFARIRLGHWIIGKKLKQRLTHRFEVPSVQSNADQRRGDAFGAGVNIMRHPFFERIAIGIEDEISIANNGDAINVG